MAGNNTKNTNSGRAGQRKDRRKNLGTRTPRLGYYLIVTDTRETEKNYFTGLRDSIPAEYKDHIVIRVEKSKKTEDLVERTIALAHNQVQYCLPWIVFDRDEVPAFDDLIDLAEKNGIQVGWSNPCIEIWFSAYFGQMPSSLTSQECWKQFAVLFKRRTGHDYSKNDSKIYEFLKKYGDEQKAIQLANIKLRGCHGRKPSCASPACTVHQLVKEILDKTQK